MQHVFAPMFWRFVSIDAVLFMVTVDVLVDERREEERVGLRRWLQYLTAVDELRDACICVLVNDMGEERGEGFR